VLTGGDKIEARFMRQDFFEFTPAFKLVIAGNHKPGLRSVDEAIRRRFKLVPFTVTIPPDERDELLAERLKHEFPGILAWAIEGCLDWLERGLAAPEAVCSATEAYLEAEDALAAWIQVAGERDVDHWEGSEDLYRAWAQWAGRVGEYVGSLKKFSQRLEERGESIGMRKARHPQTDRMGFCGLRLTRPELPGSSDEYGS
jgi:putative DNA primase/helicase